MDTDVKASLQARYGARAKAVATEGVAPAPAPASSGGCCESSCCGDTPAGANAFSDGLYDLDQLDGLPLKTALGTLGCGNPTALAELTPGEVVLDLGAGGGLDVILSAKRVGPAGHAYGVDMTDEMLSLAWSNAAAAGVGNVTFLKGDVEHLPIPDRCVDVVISNCVINLAVDKRQVMAEIFRVLRPGGRVAVSDVVISGGLPDGPLAEALRGDLYAWGSCIAGALTDSEYRDLLTDAGFSGIEVEMHRRHTTDELFPTGLPDWAKTADPAVVDDLMQRFTSSFVRAGKPT